MQEKLLIEYHKKAISLPSPKNLQGLLNSVGENAGFGSLVVVCVASTNIFMDFLLLIGSCCRVRLVCNLVVALLHFLVLPRFMNNYIYFII